MATSEATPATVASAPPTAARKMLTSPTLKVPRRPRCAAMPTDANMTRPAISFNPVSTRNAQASTADSSLVAARGNVRGELGAPPAQRKLQQDRRYRGDCQYSQHRRPDREQGQQEAEELDAVSHQIDR